MSEELDQILDPQPDPEPQPDPTPDPEPGVSRAEFAQVLSAINDLTGAISATQRQAPPPAPAGEIAPGITAEDLFANPQGVIKRAVDSALQEAYNKTVAPAAMRFAGSLASGVIREFKRDHKEDPLYNGVEPLFDKELSTMNKEWLGQLGDDDLAKVVSTAYKAAYGDYVMGEAAKKRAAKSAANLSGSGAGSSGATKSLKDIDVVSYNWAVQNGWTQEQMDELAAELTNQGAD